MQYFENDVNLAHEYIDFQYSFGKYSYKFRTDSGTFSHGHIDSETALLMSQMKRLKGSFLDLGCGCGCIGIIMSKEYGLTLTQLDVNERAVSLANYNRIQNEVEGRTLLSDCYSAVENEKFDTIALNPPIHAGKNITYKMYEEAPLHLNDGGCLYVVTLKKHGADSTKKKLKQIFGNCDVLYSDGGNYVLRCTKNHDIISNNQE